MTFSFFLACASLKAISKKSSVSTLKKLVVMGPGKSKKSLKKLYIKKARKAEQLTTKLHSKSRRLLYFSAF